MRGRPPWARRPRPPCRVPGRDESGFILLESLIAISLITVILAALGSFTLRTVQATNDLRARQSAAQVATTAMAGLGAVPATDLLTGRDAASVRDQFRNAPDAVSASLTSMTQVSDATATAGAGATANVPTSATTQVLNAITYSVSTYLGSCVVPTGVTACSATGTGVTYLRAVVAVTWSNRGCSSGTCTFVTTTLVNADSDPVFNTNAAVPPSNPMVKDPGPQVTSVGGTVNLQLAVVDNTGVPPLTWAITSGALPAGVSLSASGLISGTPTTVQPATPLTVTVTDAFGRTGSGTFTFKVLAAPTVTAPATQFTGRGTAVSLAIASTCPDNPCTFTLANAPAGLTINADTGVISGTPTAVGTSPAVTVTITDADASVATTAPFIWIITTPPTVTGPGPRTFTVGTTVRIPIPYTCPTPTCTITLTGGIPGLTLTSTDSATTGSTTFTTPGSVDTSGTTNLAAGKTVSQSSTNFGGSPARAVDGNTDGVYNDGSVSHTDIQAQPWWQVDLGAASLVRAVRIWNRTDCCDTRLSNFYVFTSPSDMSGRTAAQLLADPTITVQRVSGLGGQPNVTIPAQSAARYVRIQLSGTDYLSLAEVQVLGTVDTGSSITVGATSGTVYATGVIPASAVPSGTSKVYNPNLAITDSTGTSGASAAGPWTVVTPPTVASLETRAMRVRTSPDVPVPYTCPNAPCTLTLAGTVPGLGLSATSGVTTPNNATTLTVPTTSGTVYVNGLIDTSAVPTGTSKVYTPRVTITDNDGVTASSTGTWTVTKAPSLTNPGTQAVLPLLPVDLTLASTCPNGGCTYAMQVTPNLLLNLGGLSINSSTGRITGALVVPGTYTIRVTVTDSLGLTDTATFSMVVQPILLVIPPQVTTKPSSGTTVVTLDLSTLVTPRADGYRYTLSNTQPWLSLDPTTGLLTATITPTSTSALAATVTVTSTASSASFTTAALSWTLR